MRTYKISGWTDRGTFETVIFMARNMREAKQVANECGLYPTEIKAIK